MASANTINLKIETSPTSSLFNLSNMAPGDTESKLLTVKNTGDTRFEYKVSSRKELGSDELFNLLSLQIKQGTNVVANTKLNNLSNLRLGELGVGGYKEFDFVVYFPVDAGNEYQELSTTVAFDFIATADGGTYNPPDEETGGETPEYNEPIEKPTDPTKPTDSTPMEPSATPNDPTNPIDSTEPTEVPDEIIEIDPPDIPSSGIELPKTSSPWFNLLLISGIFIVLSILLLSIALKIDRSKK